MEYELSTSRCSYIEQYEISMLEKLGFTFDRGKVAVRKTLTGSATATRRYIDGSPTIEIDTLEELMEFVRRYGQIVLDIDTIEIYDDYRE